MPTDSAVIIKEITVKKSGDVVYGGIYLSNRLSNFYDLFY